MGTHGCALHLFPSPCVSVPIYSANTAWQLDTEEPEHTRACPVNRVCLVVFCKPGFWELSWALMLMSLSYRSCDVTVELLIGPLPR